MLSLSNKEAKTIKGNLDAVIKGALKIDGIDSKLIKRLHISYQKKPEKLLARKEGGISETEKIKQAFTRVFGTEPLRRVRLKLK